MDKPPVRSDDCYLADIRAVLQYFYQPGDSLALVRSFHDLRMQKCEMCGGKVDIIKSFELRNVRSGKSIICGRKCIVKYAIVLKQMNQTPQILFPEKYRAEAERINRHSTSYGYIDPKRVRRSGYEARRASPGGS